MARIECFNEAAILALLERFAASPAAERKELVRMLALRTHPDKGGDPDVFRVLQSRKADFLQGRAS